MHVVNKRYPSDTKNHNKEYQLDCTVPGFKKKKKKLLFYFFTFCFFIHFFFWDYVSHSPGWPRSHYVAKDDFELITVLSVPPAPSPSTGITGMGPHVAGGERGIFLYIPVLFRKDVRQHCPRKGRVFLDFLHLALAPNKYYSSRHLDVWEPQCQNVWKEVLDFKPGFQT